MLKKGSYVVFMGIYSIQRIESLRGIFVLMGSTFTFFYRRSTLLMTIQLSLENTSSEDIMNNHCLIIIFSIQKLANLRITIDYTFYRSLIILQ